MRLLTLTLAIVLTLTASACGGDDGDDAPAPITSSTPSAPTSAPTSAPVSEAPEAFDGVESTLADAEEFAVALEQDFFETGYSTTLDGAIAAAKRTGLQLEPGNSIGSYVFDPEDSEFQLCVENTSGAWATYDTRPMSMRESGDSGGCP